jgi:hypothetical protein
MSETSRGEASASPLNLLAPANLEWMERAACKAYSFDPNDEEANWWFSSFKIYQDKAKAVCAGCPVQPDCRDYALENTRRMKANRELSYDYGVFGGLSQADRYDIIRKEST